MTTVNQQVAISINQNKLLSNLEYSFTKHATVLGEIIQNANRAGATKVEFDVLEDGTLVVTDNGKGISDFQNLFTIAESGWDQEIVTKEKPFGMGFLSALYACKKISIISNGMALNADTAEILAGQAFQVKVIEKSTQLPKSKTYTKIYMHGFSLDQESIVKTLKNIAFGFPIDVIVAGEALPAPHRYMAGDQFIEVKGIGKICVKQIDQSKIHHASSYIDFVAYLQGQPVLIHTPRTSYKRYAADCHDLDIVHLDSLIFTGRLPDRDVLVNEAEAITKISNAINDIKVAKLAELKSKDMAKFATREVFSHAIALKGGFELYCDEAVPFPNYNFDNIDPIQPSCFGEHDKNLYQTKDMPISYEALVAGTVNLCTINDMAAYEESNAPAWVFAQKLGWQLFSVYFGSHYKNVNHELHWSNSHIHELESQDINVSINNEHKRQLVALDDWEFIPTVVLCDSYSLSYTDKKGKTHEVTVDDKAVLTIDGLLLMPKNERDVHSCVLQGGAYANESDFLEDLYDRDGNTLALAVEMMRSGDEVKALESLINGLNLQAYAQYEGIKYEMTIDSKGNVTLKK